MILRRLRSQTELAQEREPPAARRQGAGLSVRGVRRAREGAAPGLTVAGLYLASAMSPRLTSFSVLIASMVLAAKPGAAMVRV